MNYMAVKAQNKLLNMIEARSGQLILQSKPIFFWFALCGPCNLKCSHCAFQVFGRTSEQEVSDQVYSEVMAELMPTAYVCHLGGNNYGEMTLSKNFHRFLLDAKKFGVGLNLTTNGTRLLNDWFDNLLDVLAVIGFSMEGMNEEFERVRGFRWNHFLKNVAKVCQGRADTGKKFRVEWRYCAHAGSIHQLPDMIRLAKSIGVDRIQIMNFVPFVASQKYNSLFYHRSLANQYFAKSRRVAAELNFDINIPPDFNVGELGKMTAGRDKKTSGGERGSLNGLLRKQSTNSVKLVNCYRPWQTCVVNELGEVRPSDVYWKSMGNLQKAPFASVWNGARYRRVRASVNTKPDRICYSCRLPQFDNEENRAAMQLVPSLRQQLTGFARRLVEKSPLTKFAGIMDKEFDPTLLDDAGCS